MPEAIVTRILRLPGYGAYAWEADEATNTLTLAIRQTYPTELQAHSWICATCRTSVNLPRRDVPENADAGSGRLRSHRRDPAPRARGGEWRARAAPGINVCRL